MADDPPGSALEAWAKAPLRTSYAVSARSPGSEGGGSIAVGVTIDRQGSGTSFATTNRSSLPGGGGRRRAQVDNKASLLGALGLGASFFRGNVKDEMKKQVVGLWAGAGAWGLACSGAGLRGAGMGFASLTGSSWGGVACGRPLGAGEMPRPPARRPALMPAPAAAHRRSMRARWRHCTSATAAAAATAG